MVDIAQLVRVPGCGPGGRRFEPDYPPHFFKLAKRVVCFNLQSKRKARLKLTAVRFFP